MFNSLSSNDKAVKTSPPRLRLPAPNVFVVSGPGQAALTMPLMAPLADLAGVTRQGLAALAFQLGDGFTS